MCTIASVPRALRWQEICLDLTVPKVAPPKRAASSQKVTVGLINICPSVFAPHDIFDLLPLHFFALKVPSLDDKLVGTCPALEAVLPGGILVRPLAARDGQAVAAAGTN